MFYIDSTYIIFVLPAFIFALWAQNRVKSAYREYSQVPTSSGLTASEAAARLLRNSGIYDVEIGRIPGELSDHYDPRNKTLSLSAGTYDSSSVAAIAVAAHEVGHAVQHDESYAPLAIRNGLVPIVNIGSNAAVPLFLLGAIFQSGMLMDVGLVLFFGAVLFQVITLPVEYNASKKAVAMLEGSGLVTPSETIPVGNMLNAAALTYVAATAVALAQFMRLVVLRGNGRRR